MVVNYADYDVSNLFSLLEAKKHYIVLGAFAVSMLISQVIAHIANLIKKPKVEHAFVNVDEFASNVYRKLFMCFINRDYDELSKICNEDGMHSLRLIYSVDADNISVPLTVNCDIVEYDHEDGFISVICVGKFADNSISRHCLKFIRTDDDVYLLNDIGGV